MNELLQNSSTATSFSLTESNHCRDEIILSVYVFAILRIVFQLCGQYTAIKRFAFATVLCFNLYQFRHNLSQGVR